MQSEVDKLVIDFEISTRITKMTIRPVLAHSVINYISAAEVWRYFKDAGCKVSLKSIQRWRREVADWLGLGQSGVGRPSAKIERERRNEWHRINGYPKLTDFVDGWIPTSIPDSKTDASNAPRTAKGMTQNDKRKTDRKSPAERPPKIAKKAVRKTAKKVGNQPPSIELDMTKKPVIKTTEKRTAN